MAHRATITLDQEAYDQDRHINLKQIRVVDISRLKNRQGILEHGQLAEIQRGLRLVFGMAVGNVRRLFSWSSRFSRWRDGVILPPG